MYPDGRELPERNAPLRFRKMGVQGANRFRRGRPDNDVHAEAEHDPPTSRNFARSLHVPALVSPVTGIRRTSFTRPDTSLPTAQGSQPPVSVLAIA